MLRGRCRRCAEPIGIRYPLVEIGGALCAAVGVYRFGFGAAGAVAGFFLLWLLAIAVIDWEHMVIPHTLTVSGIVVAVATAALTGIGPAQALLGAAVGAGVVLTISYGYQIVRGQQGMGGGDVMLMGMIGAFLGPWPVAAVLFGGALLGTLYVLARYRGRIVNEAKLPFGTFLAVAAAIVASAVRMRRQYHVETAALSGGVFQNVTLVEGAKRGLEEAGFSVLIHRLVPPNDGGE
jgi:leader peptidase (prepilin peptidase)/N-methyltransferase